MFQQIDIEGEWWFPNKKDLVFNGKLTFSQEKGGSLTIYGPEDPFITLDTSNERDFEETLILGKLNDGKDLTLLSNIKPNIKSIRTNYYTFSTRTFLIDYIFIGFHFSNKRDLKFESLSIEYSNIEKWLTLLSNHGIVGRFMKTFTEHQNGFLIEYYYGKTIDIQTDNCKIQFFSHPSFQVEYSNKSTITHKFYVKLILSENKTFDDYMIMKSTIQDFLNFVITYEILASNIIGNVLVTDGESNTIKPVNILYRSSISSKMDKIKVISPYLPIFSIKKISELIQRWFNLRNKIPAVYDLYFGVMYNNDLYMTNKFLMLAEALEIYSGIKINKDLVLEKSSQINKIIEEIDESTLSNQTKNWLTEIIKFKNTLSFKEKMQYVYDYYNELLPFLSTVIGTNKEFADKVTYYRNRLTHANIDYNELHEEDLDLFWKYKDIQLILQLCILSELGYSINDLKKLFHIDKFKS